MESERGWLVDWLAVWLVGRAVLPGRWLPFLNWAAYYRGLREIYAHSPFARTGIARLLFVCACELHHVSHSLPPIG